MADPTRRHLWRIAVSLGYPHPDILFSQLTPEQAFELCAYHGMEPFGEERADLRMGKLLQFYYDAKRGKKGKRVPVGAFTLYPDVVEAAEQEAGMREFQAVLSKFAEPETEQE